MFTIVVKFLVVRRAIYSTAKDLLKSPNPVMKDVLKELRRMLCVKRIFQWTIFYMTLNMGGVKWCCERVD